MRQAFAMLATAISVLLLTPGCGSKSYELRLNKTLDDRRYEKRLNDNLGPAEKGKFETLSIYVRPPKGMTLSKAFLLPPPEPGKFDIEASFSETGKSASGTPAAAAGGATTPPPAAEVTKTMHVLARRKAPKNAKKKNANAVDTSNRGEFTFDVMSLVHAGYGTGGKPGDEKFKEETKRGNRFKHAILESGDKNIQVYIYKQDPYDVALIFEYPKSEQASLVSKMELTRESFAVGNRAANQFKGLSAEESGTAEGQGQGVVF